MSKSQLTNKITLYCAILLSGLCISNNVIAVPFDFGVKGGFENFRWEEFDDNGTRLLEESGVRFAITGFLGNTARNQDIFIYHIQAKNYLGSVDYDGQTIEDGIPATTTTNYTGFSLDGEAGARAGQLNGPFFWDFVATIKLDTWTRELEEGRTIYGQPTSGGKETYVIFNLGMGTGPEWHSGGWAGRVIFGVKLPVVTYELLASEDTPYTEDITLEPKGRASPFVNFNNSFQLSPSLQLRVDAYYDTYRFDKSDSELAQNSIGDYYYVWQPESHQDLLGIQVGIAWQF